MENEIGQLAMEVNNLVMGLNNIAQEVNKLGISASSMYRKLDEIRAKYPNYNLDAEFKSRYDNGDTSIGPLGENMGKYEYLVRYSDPKTFEPVEPTKPPDTIISLNPTAETSEPQEPPKDIFSEKDSLKLAITKIPKRPGSLEEFIENFTIYNRLCCEHLVIEEWLKTLDYGSYQKCNIYPGAPSNIVAGLFQQGLICTIYPSPQLSELRNFPAFILKGINEFISILGHPNIYIRFYSACPEWEAEKGYIPGNHLIKIGVTQKPLSPNSSCTKHISAESWKTIAKRRAWGLKDIYNQLVTYITEKQNVWIYQYTQSCLVLSTTTRKTKERDMEILKGIYEEYASTQILLTRDTCLHYCDSFSKDEDHLCSLCNKESEDNGIL